MSCSGSTVDEREVEKHSRLAGCWWDGGLGGLHAFNNLRIPLVVDSLCGWQRRGSAPLAGKRILDVGCGGGFVAEELARLGAEVTGIDPSPELIELAREHCAREPAVCASALSYLCTTVEEHAPRRAQYYDAVVASEVLDHVADVDLFLRHCAAALRPGGKIFITAPNRTRLAQFLVIYVAENILRRIPKGIHHIEKFVTPSEVSAMLNKYDCKTDNTYGIFFLPFINKWIWVFFQTMWYALVATKHETNIKQEVTLN